MSIRPGSIPSRRILSALLAVLAAGVFAAPAVEARRDVAGSGASARWFEGRPGDLRSDAGPEEGALLADRSRGRSRDDGWRPERPDRGASEPGWRSERPRSGGDDRDWRRSPAPAPDPDRLTPDKIERWKRLTPEERDRLKERYRRWKELPPEQRERETERLRRWRALPEEDRDAIRGMYRGWRELPPERRDELRGQIGEWRSLPPAEREERMKSWRFYRDQPPEGQKAIRRYLFDRAPERPDDGSRGGGDAGGPGGRRR